MEELSEQLKSYSQNSEVSMTKEQYFEMCEMLGSEPVDAEIPVEFDDLPLEVQEAYTIYNVLQDSWEPMSGSYLGKNMVGIKDIFEIYKVEDMKLMLYLISLIDYNRRVAINSKKSTSKTPPAKE